MKTKEFIQLFVPPIYYKVKRRLFQKPEQEWHPLPQLEEKGDRLIIIGNGPSLNKSMELYGDVIKQSECLMVNHSASTDLFEYLRPSFYLLVDPAWIYPESSTHKKAIINTLNAIVTKVSWQMSIVMPRNAIGGYAEKLFKTNSNIKVLFYDNHYLRPKNMSQYEAWDKNIICPPAQTVLNTAVWLSIYWGYQETYLIGADTSFIQDIYVGQKDNVLYTVDTHFYKNKDVYDCDFEPEKHGRKFGMDMEKFLDSVYKMFQSYKELRQYADWKMVKVYNASEYSLIDCFERKKLR